jgi:hypothetical protein
LRWALRATQAASATCQPAKLEWPMYRTLPARTRSSSAASVSPMGWRDPAGASGTGRSTRFRAGVATLRPPARCTGARRARASRRHRSGLSMPNLVAMRTSSPCRPRAGRRRISSSARLRRTRPRCRTG